MTDYLDVKFNLSKHAYEPYCKPNDKPMYIHVDSNHPPHVQKHIPRNLNQRLSNLSTTEEAFDRTKPPYQKALDEGGHQFNLKYQKASEPKKRQRTRNPIYFNPPFSKSVKTNVIRTFLSLIDKDFPKGHKLHMCLNRNTVKATYCTMPNMKQIIGKHNAKLLNNKNKKKTLQCNCRVKENCPISGECNQFNVVYQADVHGNDKIMTYFGSTKNFKSRYSSHKSGA